MFRKGKEEQDLDNQLLKKIGDKDSKLIKPSKNKFLYQGPKRDLAGLEEDYPYNWYLGGITLFKLVMLSRDNLGASHP